MNQYQKKVYAFALGKLSSRVDAEEIVQETWLRVFVNIKNLKNPGSLAAWIFSICSNCINYFLRKQAQKPPVYDADVEELRIEVEEENGWYEYADLLGLVVNQLKSHHQDVIKLKYVSGLKNREIGAVLGISSNQIKSRLHEARVKIKELLPGLYQDVRLSQCQLSDLKEKIMNKVELVQRGSHILCRLSLEDQVRFCETVSKGQRFDESLLQEIGNINGGLEFIKDCDARLQLSELADILAASDKSTSKRILNQLDELHNIVSEAVKRNMIISRFAEEMKDETLTVRFQRVESDEQCLILYLIGYIDSFNAAISRKRLFRALEGGYTRLILHCGGFNYISSNGIGLFADLFKTLRSRGGSLIILKMKPMIYEVFELLGLSQFFIMKDSLEQALVYFKQESQKQKPGFKLRDQIDKARQRLFIPLKTNDSGLKQNTASLDCGPVELFGFYEGAEGVSGDYFDFQKLDDDHVAVIKCDVAGQGSSAYRLMVGIAAIYLNFFKAWSYAKDGIHLEKLIYTVNDYVEQQGPEGRFAAFIVMVINIHTGECRISHAGDSQFTIYNGKSAHIQTLVQKPAAGVFPNELVKMQNGYEQVTYQLNPGEAFFLFTDGIEESRRQFRDSSFNPTTCEFVNEGGGNVHGDSHCTGTDNEEFGISRINDIRSAVFARDVYRLIKYHNPLGDEDLSFDFSSCAQGAQEAVLALASIERVFRLSPDPASTTKDKILLDPAINDFLKKHFVQFDKYLFQPTDGENSTVVYSHLKEDPQYDDITVLGIHRNE